MQTLKQSNGDGTFSTVTSSFPVSIPISGADSYDMHIHVTSDYGGTESNLQATIMYGSYADIKQKIIDGKLVRVLLTFSVYYESRIGVSSRIVYPSTWDNSADASVFFVTPDIYNPMTKQFYFELRSGSCSVDVIPYV